jgi:methionyl aminopeptidase
MPRDLKTGLLRPGIISPRLTVPDHIIRPEYVDKPSPAKFTGSNIKTIEQIEKIRTSGNIAQSAIEYLRTFIKPGITTDELDKLAHEYLIQQGAYPSTLGYRGYPKSICTSINEVICHGIPDDTELVEGDIINIDITAYKDGFHGDCNQTFMVGQVKDEVKDLVERTREALTRGISVVSPGRQVNLIGRTIESFAKRFNYGVVRDFTGHGIGESFHSGLIIPHYDSAPLYSDVCEVGMTFTIEPMLTLGTHKWRMWDDGWTVVTEDGSMTAQFEHTIVVTDSGAEILTLA